MVSLDNNLWFLSYPLKLLGVNVRRNVSVIRLKSGKIIIHSTGPFTGEDVSAISALGTVSWLVEAMLRHDTFSQQGREAFPNVPYLAPPGFAQHVDFVPRAIVPAPADWTGEVDALELQGAPGMRETVFFHRSSRTLIVADLVYNFPRHEPLWSELMLRAAVGSHHEPGMSRAFKISIKDEAAFQQSIAQMLAWDFDRVIVGHGDVIETEGKEKVTHALKDAGVIETTAATR